MNEQQQTAIDRMIETLGELAQELKALKHETDDDEIHARMRQIALRYRNAQTAWNDGWIQAFEGTPR